MAEEQAIKYGQEIEAILEQYNIVLKKFPSLSDKLTFDAYLNYVNVDFLYQKLENIETSLENMDNTLDNIERSLDK